MELRTQPDGGRGLYATRAFKRGEAVLCELPLAVAAGPLANWHLAFKVLRGQFRLPDGDWAPGGTGCGLRSWDAEDEKQLAICRKAGIDEQQAKYVYDLMCTYSICANSVHLCDADGKQPPRVLGFYKCLAMANHSCNHNCVMRPSFKRTDHALYLLAIRDISAGDELLVTYVSDGFETVNDIQQRRAYLLKEFGFVCQCEKCEPKK
jgi:hypothetical protein